MATESRLSFRCPDLSIGITHTNESNPRSAEEIAALLVTFLTHMDARLVSETIAKMALLVPAYQVTDEYREAWRGVLVAAETFLAPADGGD
jgi:hypothetical protein